MVMGICKNLRVFNFAILLKLRKFDPCEIYVFYSRGVTQAASMSRKLENLF